MQEVKAAKRIALENPKINFEDKQIIMMNKDTNDKYLQICFSFQQQTSGDFEPAEDKIKFF